MEAKSFAVGLRVEHPQTMISETQYGPETAAKLPAASYKVTANLENGRGVYSFCMCPGGYVVNASSEEERLAVNGMSYHRRDGKNANSAVIVTVTPEDFEGSGPLSGVAFQRQLEEKAYLLGKGKIPQQLFGDFESQKSPATMAVFSQRSKGSIHLAPYMNFFQRIFGILFVRECINLRDISQILTVQTLFYPAWRAEPLPPCALRAMRLLRAIKRAFILVEKAQDMRAALCRLLWMA